MNDLSGYDLILFDMDGTIADWETKKLLPGVWEWFSEYGEEKQTCIVTNQGGVGLRHWMESEGFGNPEQYPTEDDAQAYIHRINEQLPSYQRVLVCFAYQSRKGNWSPIPPGRGKDFKWSMKWRKPNPGMLLYAIKEFDALATRTLMVGDRDEDRLAAEAVQCDFVWAWDFFGRDRPEEDSA